MQEVHCRGRIVCELLGCRLPIVLAGMGGVSRSEIVSAVSDAGAFGFLGMVREPVSLIETEVSRVREAGHSAFGVNIIPAATDPGLLEKQAAAIIALKVPVVSLFWDLDVGVVERFRREGLLVVQQVGSVEEAVLSQKAGAQIIVAQGVEAGGHVRGVTPLHLLLPEVASAVDVPVLAAGGLSHGGDLTIAMALGAAGVVLGTAMLATSESFAHDYHKRRLLSAQPADTILTDRFHINWPAHATVRVLKNDEMMMASSENDLSVIGEEEGRPIYRFSTDSPLRSMTGDFASMALYAGTGVGSIESIPTAGDRLRTFWSQARTILPSTAPMEFAGESNVCFAGEFSGVYMGHPTDAEIQEALSETLEDLLRLLTLDLLHATEVHTLAHPPFASSAMPIAAGILLLEELGAKRKDTIPFNPFVSSMEEPINAAVHLRTDIGERLTRLIPRMHEDHRRHLLTTLAQALSPSPGLSDLNSPEKRDANSR